MTANSTKQTDSDTNALAPIVCSAPAFPCAQTIARTNNYQRLFLLRQPLQCAIFEFVRGMAGLEGPAKEQDNYTVLSFNDANPARPHVLGCSSHTKISVVSIAPILPASHLTHLPGSRLTIPDSACIKEHPPSQPPFAENHYCRHHIRRVVSNLRSYPHVRARLMKLVSDHSESV